MVGLLEASPEATSRFPNAPLLGVFACILETVASAPFLPTEMDVNDRDSSRKDSVQVKPTREKLAGGFLFSDRKRKENALLRPDLKVDENTRLVNKADGQRENKKHD